MKPISDIHEIESVVKQGKAVISGDDSTIIGTVLRAVDEGTTATFYVSLAQQAEIMRRHCTPDRIKTRGLEPISDEERERIKTDFSIDVDGYFNHMKCPRCGHEYGMYEFIQQGVAEHGIEAVKSVFTMINTAIVRVNPRQVAVCVKCKTTYRRGCRWWSVLLVQPGIWLLRT
jgi:hypothetical protein